MDTAPKDRPILLWSDPENKHPNCGYCGDAEGSSRLCLFHAHAEGGGSFNEVGPVVGIWGGGWDDRSYEEPSGGWMPDWWMLHDGNLETAINPIAWAEIPPLRRPLMYLIELRHWQGPRGWSEWHTTGEDLPATLGSAAAQLAAHIEDRRIVDPLTIARVTRLEAGAYTDATVDVLTRCATDLARDGEEVPHWCRDWLPD